MTRNEPDPQSPPPRQRIAKAMARAGLCSRRDAEAWIVAGRVSVNGVLLTSPALDVSPEDTILVDNAPLPAADKTRLFLFHKPRGLVTSDRDPEGRATVADFLHENWPDGPRVVTIGRLDINTEGLLLLTNDGSLARVLELPQTGWLRRYRVRAKGTANPADLDALAHGVTIDGIDYAGIEAKLDRTQGANCWLTMGLREGKNREIKRVLEHLGLEVNRLIRLSFGPFQLLDLPEGAVEEIRTRVLRDQLGENLAKQAGVDFGEAVTPTVPAPEARLARRARTDDRPRGGDRSLRSRPGAPRGADARTPSTRRQRDDAPLPERQRPVAGTRKHVSTMRAEPRDGPRKRIERSDTRDRRDRTITVERLVAPRGETDHAQSGPRRRPGPPGRRADERPNGRPQARGDGPDRRAEPSNGRGQRDRAPRGERTTSHRGPERDERRMGDRRPATAKPRGDARPGQREARSPGRSAGSREDQAGFRHDREHAGRPRQSTNGRAARDGSQRSHESPSARGKRERVARSGQERGDAAPPARERGEKSSPRRHDRPAPHGLAPKREDGRAPKPRSSNGPRDRPRDTSAGRSKTPTGPAQRRGPATGRLRPDKPRGPRKP